MDKQTLATTIRKHEEKRLHAFLNGEAKKQEEKPIDLRLVKTRRHWQGTV
jgi:hypothetical protein